MRDKVSLGSHRHSRVYILVLTEKCYAEFDPALFSSCISRICSVSCLMPRKCLFGFLFFVFKSICYLFSPLCHYFSPDWLKPL